MTESATVFDHPRCPVSSTENFHHTSIKIEPGPTGSDAHKKSQQPRQKLSCTKCRERKVKCDRTKPCSACCARGAPKECHFVAQGGDYAPIQQSYELRKLRAENLKLKERLRAAKLPIEDDDIDRNDPLESQHGERLASKASKRRNARQRRFQGSEWSDSIYFGSPGLANVINEFASVNLTSSTQSLAHLMPRGADMYAPKEYRPYPFATLFQATPEQCIPELLSCLPPSEELLSYLESFQDRVPICSFPHVPAEITKTEVERFLSDKRKNAEMYPDMLALLFAALALGAQHSVWDRYGGKWVAGAMEAELKKSDIWIAASMQALRLASYMSKPTLLGIQALIMIGPYLTNSGRFLDAWTLFGTTIRLAQAIGLHRHPKYLDPAPPSPAECSIRQTLWWWMLHMDQEYSMTLGRPLGISGIGDCPPPYELTSNPTHLRFGEFVNHFTVLARQILSSDRLSNAKIDEYTDALRKLLDTMPEQLQFDDSWLDKRNEIPEWPHGAMAAVFYCKIHNYLIILNRQRLDKGSPHSPPTATRTPPEAFHAVNHRELQSTSTSAKAMLRGRELVLSSSEDLLTAFLVFYARVPAALVCWTMGQQAFNSCMILLLDAMETGNLSRIGKVENAYAVFQELNKYGVHKLANLAVERVSWGLTELKRMIDQNGGTTGPRRPDGREGNMVRDINKLQGIPGNEAGASSGVVMQDTVMGNTGMLLLEDPGLQSFVPEAFAPFTWVMAGNETESPNGRRQSRQGSQDEADSGYTTKLERNMMTEGVVLDSNLSRSSEELFGAQGSAPGSAPSRYATTFFTAPSQAQGQPQGLTSPTSPSPPTDFMRHQPQLSLQEIAADLHQHPSPHLRHHSYPSILPQVPAPMLSHPSRNTSARQSSFSASYAQGQASPTSYIPQGLQPLPTSLQSLPETTTLSYQRTVNPSVHPSWAARPAAPLASLSEPAPGCSHVHNQTGLNPAMSPGGQQISAYQSVFPFHISSPGSDAKTSVAATSRPNNNRMKLEQWRKYVGCSGAG